MGPFTSRLCGCRLCRSRLVGAEADGSHVSSSRAQDSSDQVLPGTGQQRLLLSSGSDHSPSHPHAPHTGPVSGLGQWPIEPGFPSPWSPTAKILWAPGGSAHWALAWLGLLRGQVDRQPPRRQDLSPAQPRPGTPWYPVDLSHYMDSWV